MKKRLLLTCFVFASIFILKMQTALGQSGSVLNLPGWSVTTSKMAIPPLNTLITSYPFTVEMWVKPNMIIPGGGFWVDRSGSVVSLQYTNDAAGGLRTDIFGTTINGTALAAVKPAVNAWHHLALIVRSDSVIVECDGVFYSALNSKTFVSTFCSKFSHIGVDSSANNSIRNVTGLFDEIRIWNTGRTRSEILTNKNITLTGSETGLVAYYNFDGNNGNNLTANALNSTITGGTFSSLNTISTLSNVTISSGTLIPAFSPNITSYKIFAPAAAAGITINASAMAPGISSISNNGATINGATPNATITCTAGDGVTTTNYTFTFVPNLIAGWDGNGITGASSTPNLCGWESTSASIPWTVANGGGGCRYRDYAVSGGHTGFTYETGGAISTTRQFMLRFDNAAYNTAYYSYPVTLSACKTYEFEWDYLLGGSATPPLTITVGIDTTKNGTGRLSSAVFTTTSNTTIYRHGKYTFSTGNKTGTYYITINTANTTGWFGITNLTLVENTTPLLNVTPSVVSMNDLNLSTNINVTGNALTNDITITAPAGISLSKSTIPVAETQCGSVITLTFDNSTTVNDSIRLTSGSVYKAIPITALPTFKPIAGTKYYILQTAQASGKVVGETSTLPTLTFADNVDAQKFEFVATATPNVYYLLNNAGQYLNYDGVSALVYSVSTNSTNSEWKIEGTSISSLNLKNVASNGYLNSAALTAGSSLTANGIAGGANIGMKLIPVSDLMASGTIDGDFEYAVTDGSPIGTWIPNKVVNLGGSLTSRVGGFGGYQSTGTKAFFMRLLNDGTSYDTISHKLLGLETGATYNLDFRYKNNTVGDAFKINVYASSTVNSKMSAARGNIFTSAAVTDGTVNQPDQLGSMTFVAPSTSCYIVFAKNVATSYFNFYLDSMVLSKKPAATLSNITSGGNNVAGFDSSVMSYNIILPAGTTITPTVVGKPTDASASVTVTPAASLPGATTILVTASDGTTKLTYTINYTVALSTDATLASIKTSAGALDPIFNKDSVTYTVIVPVGTASVNVKGIPSFSKATISGISSPIAITGGIGTASVLVTAEDGTTQKTYTLNFIEADGKNYAISMIGGNNGANSNIDISGLNITSLPYTFEMWIKPNGTQVPNSGVIYHRGTGNSGIQYSSDWQGAGKLRFMSNIGGDYGTLTDVVTAGVWHHVAVVLTDTTRTIYLDGKKYTQKINSATYNFTGGKLYIGWDSGAATRVFKGEIDEVRVWNVAKDSASLADNKLAVLTGSETNLTGYWNFDLKNLSQAVDLSADSLHGKITGGTYVPSFSRAILDLATLTVSQGKLYPAFDPAITKYNLLLPAGSKSFDVTATPKEITCTITGTGQIQVTGLSGVDTIRVTSANGLEYKDYIINFVTNTQLTLKHSYTFEDGTANDVVGTAHGTVIAGTIANGVYTTSADGQYITLPAGDIAINKYPSITMEAYITAGNGVNGVNTMVSYFGNTVGTYGTDYLFLSHKSRVAMSCLNTSAPWSAETGVSGATLDDGKKHHLVATVTYDTLTWYVDSIKVGETILPAANKIFNLSNALAYLCKGGYTGDKTWMGTIHEYNIYSGIMDLSTIKSHAFNFLASNDASLSDLKIGGTTVTGFASGIYNYDVKLWTGVTQAPEITATTTNAKASMVITQATGIPGSANVVVTAEDKVTKLTYTVTYSYSTRANTTENLTFKVYPTVTSSNFTVELNGNISNVVIYDMNGKIVTKKVKVSSTQTIEVTKPGMYIIKVESKGKTQMFKVIKK